MLAYCLRYYFNSELEEAVLNILKKKLNVVWLQKVDSSLAFVFYMESKWKCFHHRHDGQLLLEFFFRKKKKVFKVMIESSESNGWYFSI
jgi:hypothetical protein